MNIDLNDYKKLIVWQKAISLVENVYRMTRSFPKEEIFGLVSQMRRCAVSIPSNIAEGSRRTSIERKNFLRIAFGSASELETQIEIGRRLEYIDMKTFENSSELLTEVLTRLNKMIHY